MRKIEVPVNLTVREALLSHGYSPYSPWMHKLNCGGRGLCATCGVWIDPDPDPNHWHDRLASRYRYPRLACQIQVAEGMKVSLIQDKKIWGQRRPHS